MRISNIDEPAPKLRIGVISQYYIGRYGTHELVFTATIKYCDNKEAFIAKVLEFDKLGQFIYDILQTLHVPALDKIVGASLAFTIDKSNMVHEIRPFASAKKIFDLDAYFNDTEEGSTISEKIEE